MDHKEKRQKETKRTDFFFFLRISIVKKNNREGGVSAQISP